MTALIGMGSSGSIKKIVPPDIDFRSIVDPDHALAALPLADGLDELYPGFNSWFVDKVLPDLGNGTGHMVMAVERTRGVVGMAMGKKAFDEKKLRCLIVDPRVRGMGIGAELVERIMDGIGTRCPSFSVSEEMLDTLSPLIDKYGFRLTRAVNGIYRPGKTEYFFNEGTKA